MVAATASYRGTATVSSARATANVATVTIDACRFWSADAARFVWTSGTLATSSLEAEAEAERKMLEAEAAMGAFRLAHEAIGQLASSPAGRDYLRRREANSVPTTASVEEESKDEDEEDEDNGLAQSLAVTTQASSSARRSNQF